MRPDYRQPRSPCFVCVQHGPPVLGEPCPNCLNSEATMWTDSQEPLVEDKLCGRLFKTSLGWRLEIDGIGYNAGTVEEAVAMAQRAGALESRGETSGDPSGEPRSASPHASEEDVFAGYKPEWREVPPLRTCEQCQRVYGSPTLRRCRVCNGKILPER